MPRLTVAVSFANDRSLSPNLRAADAGARFDTYCKCIVVALASVQANAECDVDAVLFYNGDLPDAWRARFAAYGIRHEAVAFAHAPLAGFADKFVGSLYLLDIVAWFAACAADGDRLLVIDPDCFVAGSLALLPHLLDRNDACVYALRFPRDYDNNGCSLASIESWLAANLPQLPRTGLRAIGGEFLAVTGQGARKLAARCADLWRANLAAFAAGRPCLLTEEHVLTAAFADPELIRRDVGGELVRRIWTARSYMNVDRLSREMPVWHLPAEKHRGFMAVYDLLAQADAEQRQSLMADRGRMQRLFGLRGRIVEKLCCEVYMAVRRGLDLARCKNDKFEDHS